MTVVFTRHAREKFSVLERHRFTVSEDQVLATVKHPELIDYSRQPLLIAQRRISTRHVLRVVYKYQHKEMIKIITFYPGRKRDYA